jgi:hypothetical protein
MNRARLNRCGAALLGAVCLVGLAPAAMAAEDTTVRAFANWRGDGEMIETGPQESSFAGVLSGPVFADGEQGPVRAGQLVCMAMLEINKADGTENGSARCTFSVPDGSKAYGKISCTGVHQVGCHGDFTFTGGSGRFEGIGGGGRIIIRTEFVKSGEVSDVITRETGTGIMFWPALHYTLP